MSDTTIPIDNFSSFPKNLPRIKEPTKDDLFILGSLLGPKSQADLLEKINERQKVNGIIEILNVHCGFSMLKNCFSLPKLFLRTSTRFNHPASSEKYDKTVRHGLSKVCKRNFEDNSSTQLAPAWSFIRITSRFFE